MAVFYSIFRGCETGGLTAAMRLFFGWADGRKFTAGVILVKRFDNVKIATLKCQCLFFI
jgi:hypothetical protein